MLPSLTPCLLLMPTCLALCSKNFLDDTVLGPLVSFGKECAQLWKLCDKPNKDGETGQLLLHRQPKGPKGAQSERALG